MMAGGPQLNIKMSLGERWDWRPDIIAIKSSSIIIELDDYESAAGIRKSHSCLIRIQCPDRAWLQSWNSHSTFRSYTPPVTCHKKRVAKFLAPDWPMPDKYRLLIRLNTSLMACIHDKKLIMISTRSLWELWGSHQLLGDWGCGNSVFRLTVRRHSESQSGEILRSEVLTPIMIHNLHLEVNLICHAATIRQNRTEAFYFNNIILIRFWWS